MMPPSQDERIANHLEKLPVELHEPILSQLTLRDIIAVAKYAPEGGRLEGALEISPTWGKVWPTYLAHKQDLQTLVSLIMPVGGRLYDPTNHALDLTPGQFARRIAHRTLMAGGWQYDFFNETVIRASRNIQRTLHGLSKVTLGYICDNIALESIAVICPWLMTSATDIDEETIRADFLNILATDCECGVLTDRNTSLGVMSPRSFFRYHQNPTNLCQLKHPGNVSPNWSVPQMKAFVDGYTAVQRNLNETKAQQLRELGKMYKTHHDRLKTPGAPQSPRPNTAHVPQQLEFVARHVLRIIDIDRSLQPRSREGISRFRYAHASLVPYDWCLELWFEVMQKHETVLAASLTGDTRATGADFQQVLKELTVGDATSIPEDVSRLLPIAHQGLQHFFSVAEGDGLPQELSKEDKLRAAASRLPRVTHIDPDDPSANHPRFAIYETEAMTVGRYKTNYMPPFHPAEMEWLMAFVRCIEWMEEQFPLLAAQAKGNADKRLGEKASHGEISMINTLPGITIKGK
ncbi:hypothetical protein V8F20_008307 [Naviculisporaceae sp. PSN 640]